MRRFLSIALPLGLALLQTEGALGAWPYKRAPIAKIIDPNAIDRTQNPCQNFYQYACGRWEKRAKIASGESSRHRQSDASERKSLALLLDLLKKLDPTHPARAYYLSCMKPLDPVKGAMALRPLTSAILHYQTPEGLAKTVALLHQHSINAFFSFQVFQSFHDANFYVPYVRAGATSFSTLDGHLSMDDKHIKRRDDLELYIQRTFREFNFPQFATGNMTRSIRNLEERLARTTLPPEKTFDRTLTERLIDRSELIKRFASFPMEAYLTALGLPRDHDVFNFSEPAYVQALNQVLGELSNEEIKGYLLWRVLANTAKFYSRITNHEYIEFWEKMVAGKVGQKERSAECFDSTVEQFGPELQDLYQKNMGTDLATTESAHFLFQKVKENLITRLGTLAWLDRQTRNQAITKTQQLKSVLGNPPNILWETKPKLDSETYLDNNLRLWRMMRKRNLQEVQNPAPESWTAPWSFNASYSNHDHQIEIPYALLLPPSFDPMASLGANMGSLGFTIGHEIMHSLDDDGRAYDAKGKLVNWWSPDSDQQFKNREACLVQKANNYRILSTTINGKQVLGENIADNGGIKIAFSTYKSLQSLKSQSSESKLHEDREFFLAYAQSWCAKITPETLSKNLEHSAHAPPEFRVNGVLSEMEEFSQAFACSKGRDFMSPAVRCDMW